MPAELWPPDRLMLQESAAIFEKYLETYHSKPQCSLVTYPPLFEAPALIKTDGVVAIPLCW